MKEGANIRFISESQSFETMKEPASAQYNTIRNISRYFQGGSSIDFIDEYGNNIGNIEYVEVKPLRLINGIKQFFWKLDINQNKEKINDCN